jgi:hypothetical protein
VPGSLPQAPNEKDSGILESYLAKIRRDGVAKNVEMKQRLDALAENNTAIVTLIKAYAPHAKTPVFTVDGDKFRNYAAAVARPLELGDGALHGGWQLSSLGCALPC